VPYSIRSPLRIVPGRLALAGSAFGRSACFSLPLNSLFSKPPFDPAGRELIVPGDCPCGAAKPRLQSQRQPTRSICEVEENEEFTRKNEDGREADRRLANHRLQPLGHLTAARNLSINEFATYAPADCPSGVPEIVPASPKDWRQTATLQAPGTLIRMQRFFSPTTMPATDWPTPLCAHEPASTSLTTRALTTRGARGSRARSGLRQVPVLRTASLRRR
jgi:hypothetical protein